MSKLIGGIEAGGTKFVCIVGTGPDDIQAEITFPTTTPNATLAQAVDFFRHQTSVLGNLAAIGIASFGPIDLDKGSPSYGYITSTPKPGWSQTDVVGTIAKAFKVPIAFDTDVNGAILAEYLWGNAQGLDTCLYFTIGTGIGGGVLINGKTLHGLLHPEIGHIFIPHDLTVDPYPGHCPFHKDCLEGLASGPALQARWGKPAQELPPEHPAWDLQTRYLAYLCANMTTSFSPKRIILGGGVMQQEFLFSKIQQKTQKLLADYVAADTIKNRINTYITPPGLGNRAGLLGALALGMALT